MESRKIVPINRFSGQEQRTHSGTPRGRGWGGPREALEETRGHWQLVGFGRVTDSTGTSLRKLPETAKDREAGALRPRGRRVRHDRVSEQQQVGVCCKTRSPAWSSVVASRGRVAVGGSRGRGYMILNAPSHCCTAGTNITL